MMDFARAGRLLRALINHRQPKGPAGASARDCLKVKGVMMDMGPLGPDIGARLRPALSPE